MIVTPFQHVLHYLATTHVQIPVYTLGMVRTRYVPVYTKDDFSVPGIAAVITLPLNLLSASRIGNLAAARRCIKRGDVVAQSQTDSDELIGHGKTPLPHASHRGHVAIVQLLLESGAAAPLLSRLRTAVLVRPLSFPRLGRQIRRRRRAAASAIRPRHRR